VKTNTVETLITLAEQQARGVLLVLHQSLVPSWVIVAENFTPYIFATPWKDDEEKERMRTFIRQQIRRYEAHAYSFLTEAFMATAPPDWDPDTPLPEKDRAVNRADRQEVVIAFATDGRKRQWRRWRIRRDWNEQVIALEPMDEDEMFESESWIADLFQGD
jgi:hypothetical protein